MLFQNFIFILIFMLNIALFGLFTSKFIGIENCFFSQEVFYFATFNHWVDCGKNRICARKVAGFDFPLRFSDYKIRAKKNIIEFTYRTDDLRYIHLKKTSIEKNLGMAKYNKLYPISSEIALKNGVPVKIKADINKIYVIEISASSGYYSVECRDGLTFEDIYKIYEILAEAEAPKVP